MAAKGIARQGDRGVGICVGHSPPIPMTGTIIASATTSNCNNLALARAGDIVKGECGHTGIISDSAPTAQAEGIGLAYIGAAFIGIFSGIIVEGSDDSVVGGV